MASAKQIAWRKKFAKMSKAGKFKKAKRTSTTVKTGKMKGWDVEITGTSYAKKSNPHGKTEYTKAWMKEHKNYVKRFVAKYDKDFREMSDANKDSWIRVHPKYIVRILEAHKA